MEIFSALLALCAGNSPVPGEFPAQWSVTRSFDVFFDLCLNKRLSEAGDLRRHRAHYGVTVMTTKIWASDSSVHGKYYTPLLSFPLWDHLCSTIWRI